MVDVGPISALSHPALELLGAIPLCEPPEGPLSRYVMNFEITYQQHSPGRSWRLYKVAVD